MKFCILLFFAVIALFCDCFGQIKIKEDLWNYSDANVDIETDYLSFPSLEGYIGEVALIIPKKKSKRKYGYRNFFIIKNQNKEIYCPDLVNNPTVTKYNSLVGRSFRIIDVTYQKPITDGAVLTLVDNLDTVYYRYDMFTGDNDFIKTMIIESNFQKIKDRFIGERIYLLFTISLNGDVIDYRKNVPIEQIHQDYSPWVCDDIYLDVEDEPKVLGIISNEKGNCIVIKLQTLPYDEFHARNYIKEKDLIEVYGTDISTPLYIAHAAFSKAVAIIDLVLIFGSPLKVLTQNDKSVFYYENFSVFFEKNILKHAEISKNKPSSITDKFY